MDKERRITWDHFEAYRRCPQWFSWAFLTPKQVANAFKDTQHLIRGNATQLVVDKWAKERFWAQDDFRYLEKFLDSVTHKAVIDSWVEDQHLGRPRCRPLDITEEIQENLIKVLPQLRTHIILKAGGVPREVIPQQEVEYQWEKKVYLYARLDLMVVAQDYRRIIYEGKATRKPENTRDDQVRWQAEILLQNSILKPEDENHRITFSAPPSNTHYFIFYHTNEIKELRTHRMRNVEGILQFDHEEEQYAWVQDRDRYLRRMLDVDLKATPSRQDCHICNFRPICPDRYQPKKRITETALEPPPKGNQINIL